MLTTGYLTLCMPIHGIKQCFRIPELVDDSYFTQPHCGPGPGPTDYPELELAGTILSSVEFIDPQIKDKEFTKTLTDVANKYIQKVRGGPPKEWNRPAEPTCYRKQLDRPCLLAGFCFDIESEWKEVLRDERDDGEFDGAERGPSG